MVGLRVDNFKEVMDTHMNCLTKGCLPIGYTNVQCYLWCSLIELLRGGHTSTCTGCICVVYVVIYLLPNHSYLSQVLELQQMRQ